MVRKGVGHGGAREGSGRKPKFLTDNETVTIKVPAKHKSDAEKMVILMDELIEMGFTMPQITEILLKITKS